MSYVNADGVYVRTGISQAAKAKVSQPVTFGQLQYVDVDVSAAALPAFSSAVQTIQSRYVTIPAGVLIEKVDLIVDVQYVGVSATLNVGWVDAVDGTSHADNDAFVAAAATISELAPGVHNSGSSPCDGAGIGTITLFKKFVTVDVGTATYSAGQGRVRIYFSIPDKLTDNLGD